MRVRMHVPAEVAEERGGEREDACMQFSCNDLVGLNLNSRSGKSREQNSMNMLGSRRDFGSLKTITR